MKNKSPNWTHNDTRRPRKNIINQISVKIYPSNIELVNIERKKEPKLPDMVFLD